MSDLWRITTEFTGLPGLPGYNTLYSDTDEQSASNMLDDLHEFWEFVCSMGNSSSSGLNQNLVVTVRGLFEVIDSTTGQVTGTTSAGADSISHGNGTGEPLPPANQILLSFSTGTYFGGRKLRGRMNIPGVTEDHSTNGVVAAGAKTEVLQAATLLVESGLAVYSPTKHQWARAGSPSVWDQFAVLRSRRD